MNKKEVELALAHCNEDFNWSDSAAVRLAHCKGSQVHGCIFDDYLLRHYVLRIRLYVVGPSPRRAAPRRGFFGRPVARRPDVGGVRRGLVDEPHLARHIASFLVTTAWTDSKPHPVRPERITLESFLANRRRNRRFVDRFRLELWQQDLLGLLLYVLIYYYLFSRMVG